MERIFKIAFGAVLGALMLVTAGLVIWAAAEGFKIDEVASNPEILKQSHPQFFAAINSTLYWCYALIFLAIGSIAVGFIWGLVEKPKALISVAITAGVALPIIGVSYLLASKHAGMFVLGSDGGIFRGSEVMISETCLFVAYAVFALTFLSILTSVIYSVVRKYI